MNHLTNKIHAGEFALIFLILASILFFGGMAPLFLSLQSLLNILQQTSVVALVALAMSAVIVARGIDLSVGAVLAVSGIVAAQALAFTGGSAVAAIIAAIAVGASVGLVNGLMISFLGISPFLATLATMAAARGGALSISSASSIQVTDPVLIWAGSAQMFGVPVPFIIALLACLVWAWIFSRTVFGRWIFAVGGNRAAARASLVPVRFVEVMVYVLAGASAGLGSVIVIGRLGSAQPLAGVGLEFAAITAAVIGGTKLSGGEGRILGTALGCLLVGCINVGLAFQQVPQQIIYFVTGLLILFAVALSRVEGRLFKLAGRSGSRQAAQSESGPVEAAAEKTSARKIELRDITKTFGGVNALSHVDMVVRSGEVVALAGENGAGKSTLVKCLSGVHMPDSGQILLDGNVVELTNVSRGRAAGVAVIHQHFPLVSALTVAENIFLGAEPLRGALIDRGAMRRQARRILSEIDLDIDPNARLSTLTVGQRQLVEIAKCLASHAWLVIMDEPTSALTNKERDKLYAIVNALKKSGCAVLYISHKLEEIFELSDRIVVLRDGKLSGTGRTSDLDEHKLIEMTVGRSLSNVFPHAPTTPGEVCLSVSHLSDGHLLKDASFSLRKGEVVALAGLLGSGRSEVMRCIAGLDRYISGDIQVFGRRLPRGDMMKGVDAGIIYVPEDRHLEGVVPKMSVRDNLILAWMRRNSVMGVLRQRRGRALVSRMIERLDVRPPNQAKPAGELSGGNQQKVVIGKWLATNPSILLLDEPTRGVDVGAKAELHRLIAEFKTAGAAVLLVSSELPEVLGVSDRILVMHEGRLMGELPRGASEEEVMALAFGRRPSKAQTADQTGSNKQEITT